MKTKQTHRARIVKVPTPARKDPRMSDGQILGILGATIGGMAMAAGADRVRALLLEAISDDTLWQNLVMIIGQGNDR